MCIPMVVMKSFSVLCEAKAKNTGYFDFMNSSAVITRPPHISHWFCDSLCNEMFRHMGI